MNTIWQSLAWKEWNEHKWKLVSIVAVMLCLVVAVIATGGPRGVDIFAEAFHISIVVGGIPMAVFVGLGIAAVERSRGTLAFLQALPAPLWRVACWKLVFAFLSVAAPIFLTGLFAVLCAAVMSLFGYFVEPTIGFMFFHQGNSWTGDSVIDAVLFALPTAASLILWSAAWGVNRKDEISAGAVALAMIVGWWVVLFALAAVFLIDSDGSGVDRLKAFAMGTAPLGYSAVADVPGRGVSLLLFGYSAALITHALLAARYATRFGRTQEREVRSPRAALGEFSRSEWLPPPRYSGFSAIVWKQARESAPIVLAGIVAIVGIVAIFLLGDLIVARSGDVLTNASMVYARVAIIFGFFIALVAGIGVALQDLSPRLNTFWRSRPIRPDLWFWVKYLTGLVVVLATIYLPIFLLFALGQDSVYEGIDYPEVLAVPAGQIALFAGAVMTTCLVRHAVYAAILSIPTLYLGTLSVQFALVIARLNGWAARPADGLWALSNLQIGAGFMASFVVSTIVAWLAMRYDWGQKSRY